MNKGFTIKYHIVSAILFVAFVILAISISENDALKQWDSDVFKKINVAHGTLADSIMFVFSAYGREVVWIGTIIGLFAFGKTQGRKVSILLVIVFLILIPSGMIIKDVIDRQRPDATFTNLLIKTEHDDPSFPSGHALITSAGACIMLTSYTLGKQKILSIILGIEAAIVAFSLIDVGAHYFLDVVGGILLGTATSLILVGLQHKLEPIFVFVNSITNKIRN